LARIASLENVSSTTSRNLTTGVDPATFSAEASQLTEDQLSLDRNQRQDVQRRLTGLGFDIKANGKFDDVTRAVITRWQAARGYPRSGYLNTLQHKALQTEILATRVASSNDDEPVARSSRRRGGSGGGGRHHRGGGGGGGHPGGLLGGMMGGMFR
jgi:peptidoglycan hydrolase-like protein with peptidoglycan-binding domain